VGASERKAYTSVARATVVPPPRASLSCCRATPAVARARRRRPGLSQLARRD